jgi:hypothetical protein
MFRRPFFLLAASTFSILALELALIRWMSQQIRVFGYLNNVLLMAAFLGMGLGVALGKRWPGLVHAAMPLLLGLAAVLCYAQELGLTYISFPDRSMALWGAEGLRVDETFATNIGEIMSLFALASAVFICLGSAVGALFDRMQPLRAYSADLAGSLLGVAAVTLLSVLNTPPPVWLAAACLPVLLLSPRWLTAISIAGIIAFGALSIRGAIFSPYYRIDVTRGSGAMVWSVQVNRDNHQVVIDVHAAGAAAARAIYDLPFVLSRGKRAALVVGAGTGNDVAAALRNGFGHVVAVEIDPTILRLGRALHPQRPYADPRVEAVTNDARNYFERTPDKQFDVVCFGLLDSHAMFSSMSTLRLDNYVYTVEALRSAWRHVAPGGVMTISFGVTRTPFIADRIAANLRAATGREPTVVAVPEFGAVMFAMSNGASLAPLRARRPLPTHPIRVSTDDWPFLYMRPATAPRGYVAVLACIAMLAVAGAALVYGISLFTPARFDGVMFFFGAAFLLIETRSVTDLSLLLGSTWIVNSAVFAAVLLLAWLANVVVLRSRPAPAALIFVLLFAALGAGYVVRPQALLALPPLPGVTLGALLNALPIGLAGLLFSGILASSRDAAGSLGSNLLGAVAGGIAEYSSLVIGLRNITLIAIAFYLAAALLFFLRRRYRDRLNRESVASASGNPTAIAAAK